MKRTALKFLVCPGCRSELELEAKEQEGREVLEGRLGCRACGADYRVVRGVPRFVEAGAYASSFGYQWTRFRTVQIDSCNGADESERALEAATGWKETDYRGRRVLDAGVGAGRYAEIVAGKGGEVVGIDLTEAVDAAYRNIGRRENVHLIQADIFAMPFRESAFDLAYSIGVLHHTSDPRRAFDRVAAVVKPGGGLAVFLYSDYGIAHHSADLIRKATTRLPLRWMFLFSAIAIPLYYLYRIPVLGKALSLLFPISPHPNWRWRWLDTFDWYTPKYQWKFLYPEVFRWFRANGFLDIEIFDDPIRMRGRKSGAQGEKTEGIVQERERGERDHEGVAVHRGKR